MSLLSYRRLAFSALLIVLPQLVAAETPIPLQTRNGLDTFYVTIGVAGSGREDYLVDTGAGYMTITDATLANLHKAGTADHVGVVEGRLADGSTLRVPVYRVSEITIGPSCRLFDVEVAVLPGASRGLFGLSAIRKASPVSFSFDPPEMRLSNCIAPHLVSKPNLPPEQPSLAGPSLPR